MPRFTKKDECRMWANSARRLEADAKSAGRDDLARLASYAGSDFMNANECLLSAAVYDKRGGGGGSSEAWSLRREAAGLMTKGHKLLSTVREILSQESVA